jgi:hypothetical protein
MTTIPHLTMSKRKVGIAVSIFLLFIIYLSCCGQLWQARRESNPQPAVLETAALPIELLTYLISIYYSITCETTPAPTVRPPSRIANFKPFSMAIGEIKLMITVILSPGITISTPSGSFTSPVTSVVLK